MFLDCLTGDTCEYSVSGCEFTNSSADLTGGAIAFNYFPPTLGANTFVDTSAVYGPDIGGYAVKIVRTSELDKTYASG